LREDERVAADRDGRHHDDDRERNAAEAEHEAREHEHRQRLDDQLHGRQDRCRAQCAANAVVRERDADQDEAERHDRLTKGGEDLVGERRQGDSDAFQARPASTGRTTG
jgi:hypothetical protein